MERERGNPSANQPNTDQPSRDLEGRLPSPLPQEIGEFLARAGRAKEKGDLEGARAAYERVIALSPGLAEARYHLALIQVARNDPNGAAESLRAALESEPGEAEACFREAVRLKPDHAQAHFNLGDLLRDAGELDAAEAAFREAARIDPNYLHAFINLGATLHQKGEMEAAFEALQKALALDPASAEAHYSLGTVLESQRKYDEAINSLRRALEIDPSNKKSALKPGRLPGVRRKVRRVSVAQAGNRAPFYRRYASETRRRYFLSRLI